MDSFMCTLCSRKYSSSKTFEKHIRRCQDKRKLACPECHKEVIGQVQLDDHRRSHRGVDCNLCGERIPANSVSAHKAKVHGTSKTVKCYQCPFGHVKKSARSLSQLNSRKIGSTPPIRLRASPFSSPLSSFSPFQTTATYSFSPSSFSSPPPSTLTSFSPSTPSQLSSFSSPTPSSQIVYPFNQF